MAESKAPTAQEVATKNSATKGEPGHKPVLIAEDPSDNHPVERAKDNSATPATRDTPRVVVEQPEALTAEEAARLAKANSATPKLGGDPVLVQKPEEDERFETPNEFATRNAKAVKASPQNKAVSSSPTTK